MRKKREKVKFFLQSPLKTQSKPCKTVEQNTESRLTRRTSTLSHAFGRTTILFTHTLRADEQDNPLSHARTSRARVLPQGLLFFCCHICHTSTEKKENRTFSSRPQKRKKEEIGGTPREKTAICRGCERKKQATSPISSPKSLIDNHLH